jgi:hypothetical protein
MSKYNPYADYPMTSNWSDHRKRGSLGGHDYAMPVGTPLVALFDGIVSFNKNNGTGGYTATLTKATGESIQYLHMSRFAFAKNTRVKMGERIGYSGGAKGAVGSGSSTGPHLHLHGIVRGVRVPYFDLLEEKEKPVEPGYYRAGDAGVNIRDKASATGKRMSGIPAGDDVKPLGYVNGQAILGNDIWLVIDSNRYAWVGGFTSRNVAQLPNLTPKPKPEPEPEPEPEPTPETPAEQEPPMNNDKAAVEPDLSDETLKIEAGKIAGAIDPYLSPKVRGLVYSVGGSLAIILDSVGNVVGGSVGDVFGTISSALVGVVGAVAISHRQKV